MKNVLFFLVTCLVLLTSCGSGGGSHIVTPIAKDPKAGLFITETNIKYGDIFHVTVSVQNGEGSLKIGDNIFPVSNNDFIISLQLIKTTQVVLTVTNSDGKVATASGTVTVGPWNQSLKGLINHDNKHWVFSLIEIIQNNVVVEVRPLGPNQIGQYHIFSINGFINFYDKNNNLLWNKNSTKWELLENGKKLKISNNYGSTIYLLDKLDENFLAITYQGNLNGVIYFVRETYKIEE